MSDDSTRPIIIKRKKVVAGEGHHGGAWKVAYADFVTAMMAFFMLMWLLNATTEKQRKGLADYFTPTIAVARVSGGGDGALSGDSMSAEETLARTRNGGFAQSQPMGSVKRGSNGAGENSAIREMTDLEAVQMGITGRGGDSLVREMAKKHISTRLTDKGLVIEIFDLDGDPLFEAETAKPTPIMIEISEILIEAFGLVNNKISVAAHSRTFSPLLLENPAWPLTTDRAQSTRALLQDRGLEDARVVRVTGHGQQKPLIDDAMSSQNNRLEITLLRSDLE